MPLLSPTLSTRLSTPYLTAAGGWPLVAIVMLLLVGTTGPPAGFMELEAIDPLFDFPGASYEELRDRMTIIQESERAVHVVHPEMTGRRIYPTRFWGAIAELRAVRDRFLEQPTWLGAFNLVGAEARAARAYRYDVAAFQITFEHARSRSHGRIPDDALFPLLPGVATDIATYRAATQLLAANGDAIAAMVRQRAWCAVTGTCRQSQPRAAALQPLYADIPTAPLPESELVFLQDLIGAKPVSPRTFLYRAPCFNAGLRAAVFVLWERMFPDGTTAFYPKLATDNFFRKTAIPPPLHPDAYQASDGAYYVWQPETNWYTCPDLDYHPALATMAEVVKLAVAEPLANIFAPTLEPGAAAQLHASEYALATAPAVSVALIERYIAALHATISAAGDAGDGISGGSIGAAERRVRLWQTQSGGIAAVIAHLKPDALRYRDYIGPLGEFTTPITFMLSRSYPSLLFATWNASVWRLDEQPQFTLIDGATRGVFIEYGGILDRFGQHAIREIERRSMVGPDMSAGP